jgi:hypothetical protein
MKSRWGVFFVMLIGLFLVSAADPRPSFANEVKSPRVSNGHCIGTCRYVYSDPSAGKRIEQAMLTCPMSAGGGCDCLTQRCNSMTVERGPPVGLLKGATLPASGVSGPRMGPGNRSPK